MPFEADPPRVVDPNAVLTLTISLQRFEPVAGQRGKVLQRSGRFQTVELQPGLALDTREVLDPLTSSERSGPLALVARQRSPLVLLNARAGTRVPGRAARPIASPRDPLPGAPGRWRRRAPQRGGGVHRVRRGFHPASASIALAGGRVEVALACHLGAVGDAGKDVRLFETRVIVQDLGDARASRQPIEDQGNPDSVAPNAGLSEADLGIDRNSGEQLFPSYGAPDGGRPARWPLPRRIVPLQRL